ncbi:MAG: hypothetical protein Q4D79_08470 [Propionibacteriaceae bacterium]|nr:hypothetical protein [Propionibacteriaceae bacterium]
MSDRTFIYKDSNAQSIEDTLTKMASNLREKTDAMKTRVDFEISGWDPSTDSRQAQMNKDQQLSQRAEELADLLDKAAAAMNAIRSLAHTAEVRNVAVLD